MSKVNPTLFKVCGLVGALIFSLPVMYLGNSLLGQKLDLWSPDSWTGNIKILFALAMIAGLVGMFFGWSLGSRIEINNEKAHEVMTVILNYLGIGFVLWGIAIGIYLRIMFGSTGAKDFVIGLGAKTFGLQLMFTGALGSLSIGCIQFAVRHFKRKQNPDTGTCLLSSLPVSLTMGYIQFRLFEIGGLAWLVIASIFSIGIVFIANSQIVGDRRRQSQV